LIGLESLAGGGTGRPKKLARNTIREQDQIVVTTLDVLHAGTVLHHTEWSMVFAELT
jgi:hypothetical protein